MESGLRVGMNVWTTGHITGVLETKMSYFEAFLAQYKGGLVYMGEYQKYLFLLILIEVTLNLLAGFVDLIVLDPHTHTLDLSYAKK